jgi:O-antigen/teichoic acid export membrane protein
VIWVFIPHIVDLVIGEKWRPIVPLVRILVIAGFVRSFQALAGPVFYAVGRPDLDFKMNLPRFIATVALIWPACALFGIDGACWVVLIAITSTLPIWFYGVFYLLRVRFLEVLRVNAPAVLGSAALAAVLWALERVTLGVAR